MGLTVAQLQRIANWHYLLERIDPGALSVEDHETHSDLVALIKWQILKDQQAKNSTPPTRTWR